ncbi:hypothetical protein JR316_0012071 [Psilocybe cubensis]|uniref:Uncharacterized protein n=1 Tax=Psilocybe cubensis TaxID=181762 RepID=A0ACB8GHT4_PSICU|nr:hypothetical protein JR316_0012071 [Psilocybe cubensis]KAH9474972.1 hypothetical protein JR316_0012071 [Psilocybe cubensis]
MDVPERHIVPIDPESQKLLDSLFFTMTNNSQSHSSHSHLNLRLNQNRRENESEEEEDIQRSSTFQSHNNNSQNPPPATQPCNTSSNTASMESQTDDTNTQQNDRNRSNRAEQIERLMAQVEALRQQERSEVQENSTPTQQLFVDEDTLARIRAEAANKGTDLVKKKVSLPEIVPGFKASSLEIGESYNLIPRAFLFKINCGYAIAASVP